MIIFYYKTAFKQLEKPKLGRYWKALLLSMTPTEPITPVRAIFLLFFHFALTQMHHHTWLLRSFSFETDQVCLFFASTLPRLSNSPC